MKNLLFILLPTLFLALTYASAPTEFTAIDLGLLLPLCISVFAAQLLIARQLNRWRVAHNLILAAFVTLNILSFNLILNDVFITLPRFGQALALVLALFIAFSFMNMLDENPGIAKVLPTVIALATTGVLARTLLSAATISVEPIEIDKTSAKNIRIVNFESKPNVYFIAFDSLIPKALLRKHLRLEITDYHKVLDVHFRRFKNFFADRVPTGRSLNSLLALDIGHFSATVQNKTSRYFFPGLIPSPLFEIFKHNGYETTTLYSSLYLGREKGLYVDNYQVGSWRSNFGVCEFIPTWGLRALTFMGYCSLVRSEIFRLTLNMLDIPEPPNKNDYLIDNMRNGLQKNTPQIFVAYVFSPGHARIDIDSKNTGAINKYRRAYIENSKRTAAHLNKIVTFVAKEDPEAIVYVFGDHGPFTSRQDAFEKKNAAFFVQDRYGVYGGIHPRERCAKSFSEPYTKKFMTITQGAHMIIRCLSGGQNAFLTLENYHLPTFGTKVNNRYEDYLYE